MIGCGRLGFPVALAWATQHEMVGYDVSSQPKEIMASGKYPHLEPACQKLLDNGTRFPIVDTIDEAVAHADVVFVAVQTPHKPEFEGLNRMPAERADFGYDVLKAAVQAVSDAAKAHQKHIVMVVISTVLPGTTKRELRPIFGDNPFVSFVYSPMFIAQGTVVEDTMNPEMVLLGRDAEDSLVALETMRDFYKPLHKAPLCPMNVASAELAKVAYNVFLGLKIVAANSIMEIAHKTEANCDDVTNALALATDRVVSKKYMRGGMGDGGGCFVEGELIHTENGVKPIEEIEKGERVLASDGKFHEVLETYRRPFKGKVFTIKGRGLVRFTVTGEHPIHAARDLRAIGSDGRRDQSLGPQLDAVREVRADEITEDFYIAFPQPIEGSVREPWSPPRGKSGPEPRPIFPHGPAYMALAGYYMAEGSIWFDKSKNDLPSRVTFYFNTQTDGDYIAECVACLKEVAPDANVSVRQTNDRSTCTEVRINSTQLAKQLVHDCGHGYEEKKVPAWILNSDDNSRHCLRALFRGDGSSHPEGFSFSTISAHLAHGVALMLRRHGIASTLQFHPKRVGADGVVHRPAYDLGVNNATHVEKLAEIVGMPIRHKLQEKRYETIFQRNGMWFHKVNAVETSSYEGTVYNLNVADVHNYVSVGGLVSNCHPRDQIALSWLAHHLNLSYDLFGAMVHAREAQTEWLAKLCLELAERGDEKLPVIVLGRAYKAGTNLTIGSPAVLLKNILDESGGEVLQWDPYVDGPQTFTRRAVFVIGTNHDEFYSPEFKLPNGSYVIDPWGRFKTNDASLHVTLVGRAVR